MTDPFSQMSHAHAWGSTKIFTGKTGSDMSQVKEIIGIKPTMWKRKLKQDVLWDHKTSEVARQKNLENKFCPLYYLQNVLQFKN